MRLNWLAAFVSRAACVSASASVRFSGLLFELAISASGMFSAATPTLIGSPA
jgi:hypothetical protein